MSAGDLLLGLGTGVVIELIAYYVLTRFFNLQSKTAAMVVAMLVILFYVPWAVIQWPGADVFAMHLAIYLTLAYGLGLVGSRVGKGWHWGPALIVTFFIGVVVINVIFVTVAEQGITGLFSEMLPKPRTSPSVANSGFPGTVSHDFQEKEALYNAYLKDVEAQQSRGWQTRYGWQGKPVHGIPAALVLLVNDRDNRPLQGAAVHGTFVRTSNTRDDFNFSMSETTEGRYQADLAMPLPGQWKLVLHIIKDGQRHEIRAETKVLAATAGASR